MEGSPRDRSRDSEHGHRPRDRRYMRDEPYERREAREERDRERERSRPSRPRDYSPSGDRHNGKATRSKRPQKTGWDVLPNGSTGSATGDFAFNASMASGLSPAVAGRQSRRLYVGNIPPMVTEIELEEFFNAAMVHSNLVQSPGNPVISVQVKHDRKFAFIETRTNEEASRCMSLDGIMIHGYSLKIRRPKDYQPVEDLSGSALPGLVSTRVEDTPSKVYVGGLPYFLSEEQTKELIQSFGQLRSFHLVKDSETGKSKGFGFFDFVDPGVTERAIAGLNGMPVGDKILQVQLASVGQRVDVGSTDQGGSSTSQQGGAPVLVSTDAIPSSRVLCLLNMVSVEEIADDEEYEDIREDIQTECSKYGELLNVLIPRPTTDSISLKDVGKVYLEYKTEANCSEARDALSGRKFGEHTVVATFFPVDEFEKKMKEAQ